MWSPSTGWQQSFHTIWMWICGSLAHVNKNCRKLQILICIITTFSENFIQNKQVWPQLQPKTWFEAILKIYKSAHHFIIDSLQKCILEAAIDRLDIPLGTISPFSQDWISRQSMTASNSLQNAFLEAVNDKMVVTFVNFENDLGSRFRL